MQCEQNLSVQHSYVAKIGPFHTLHEGSAGVGQAWMCVIISVKGRMAYLHHKNNMPRSGHDSNLNRLCAVHCSYCAEEGGTWHSRAKGAQARLTGRSVACSSMRKLRLHLEVHICPVPKFLGFSLQRLAACVDLRDLLSLIQ